MERDIYSGIIVCYISYFNSHAHVERDGRFEWEEIENEYFNSHAHVERDTYVYMLYYRYSNFNSHAHVERDRCNEV